MDIFCCSVFILFFISKYVNVAIFNKNKYETVSDSNRKNNNILPYLFVFIDEKFVSIKALQINDNNKYISKLCHRKSQVTI